MSTQKPTQLNISFPSTLTDNGIGFLIWILWPPEDPYANDLPKFQVNWSDTFTIQFCALSWYHFGTQMSITAMVKISMPKRINCPFECLKFNYFSVLKNRILFEDIEFFMRNGLAVKANVYKYLHTHTHTSPCFRSSFNFHKSPW